MNIFTKFINSLKPRVSKIQLICLVRLPFTSRFSLHGIRYVLFDIFKQTRKD